MLTLPAKKSRQALIIIVAFLLAIVTPLVGAILQEDRVLSYTEKRKLQQLPSVPEHISDVPEFLHLYEEYFNDQFGLRDLFLKSYARTKRAIGDHDIASSAENIGTKNVIEGKEGWFFLNRVWDGDPFSDYRNIDLYSEGELLRAVLFFAARVDWLRELDIEYLFFFAPNKHTIYSEFIPDYIEKVGEISSWDQLNYALDRYTNVHYVDLREPLLNGKGEAARYWKTDKDQAALYFKKDSHWNGAGADIAQYEIAKKLKELFPGKIEPFRRPPEDFQMSAFTGDITLIMGGDEKEAYGPELYRSTCTDETKEDYLQRQHVTLCGKAELNAVIFNDSFMPPLKPFFTDYFRRTAYYWEQMRKSIVSQEIDISKPDIVIEQRAERFLPFTPRAWYENYSRFWQKHWHKWKKIIYRLDLENVGQGKYQGENMQMLYDEAENQLTLNALTDDPQLHLPIQDFKEDHLYLIKIEIESFAATELQVYYGVSGKEDQDPEPFSETIALKKGVNSVILPLFSLELNGFVRVDPGKKAGKYALKSLEIKELEWVSLK
jgi:hypothetical protein